VPALLNLLERKTEAREVRARAAEALGKIASVEANATALGQGMVEKINQALIAQLPDPRLALLPGNKLLALAHDHGFDARPAAVLCGTACAPIEIA
jgi:HEAT repeat protein